VGVESDRDPRFVRYGKAAAAVLLAGAVFLPIYTVDFATGEGPESRYVLDLVRDDVAAAVVPLVLTYLWPLLIFGLARLRSRRLLQLLVQFVEPGLAVASCIVILWIPQLIFETRVLFFVLIAPVTPVAGWGCYLAVAANGLYLVSWLAGLLRPWRVQEG
jgi:hypothetical protein